MFHSHGTDGGINFAVQQISSSLIRGKIAFRAAGIAIDLCISHFDSGDPAGSRIRVNCHFAAVHILEQGVFRDFHISSARSGGADQFAEECSAGKIPHKVAVGIQGFFRIRIGEIAAHGVVRSDLLNGDTAVPQFAADIIAEAFSGGGVARHDGVVEIQLTALHIDPAHMDTLISGDRGVDQIQRGIVAYFRIDRTCTVTVTNIIKRTLRNIVCNGTVDHGVGVVAVEEDRAAFVAFGGVADHGNIVEQRVAGCLDRRSVHIASIVQEGGVFDQCEHTIDRTAVR